MSGKFDRSAFIQKFILETRENIQRLNASFLKLEKNSTDDAALQDALRTLHTVKGSAKMMSLASISQLIHAFEESVGAAQRHGSMKNPQVIEVFLKALDFASGHLEDIAKDGFSTTDIQSYIQQFDLITGNQHQKLDLPAGAAVEQQRSEPPKRAAGKGVVFDRKIFIERFLTEAAEHIQNLENRLVAWQKSKKADDLEICVRAAHTLKGSARMMKFENIGNLSQRVELFFRAVKDGKQAVTGDTLKLLSASFQSFQTMVGQIRVTEKDVFDKAYLLDLFDQIASGKTIDVGLIESTPLKKSETIDVTPSEPVPEGTADRLGERLIQAGLMNREQLLKVNQTTDAGVPLGERLIALGMIKREQLNLILREQRSLRELMGHSQIHAPKIQEPLPVESDSDQFVHIRLDKMDHLIQSVGEIASRQIRNEDTLRDLRKIYDSLRYWSREFRDTVQQPALYEKLHLILETFSDQIKNGREDAANFDLIVREIQNGIMSMRMVPIRSVFDGFPRAVRDLARNLGKEVQLIIEGADTELDRKIVEGLNEPLIHLIRNAIDHGLETPAERTALGKTREGLLRISAVNEGNTILVEVEDDGRGIDLEKIKKRAIEKQIITDAQDIHRFSENDLINLIFLPSFSTSEIITDISGRGFGMDVVKRSVEALKGTIDVVTAKNIGSRFAVHLPLTLTSLRAIFVREGTQRFALPLASVAETIKIQDDAIIEVIEKKAIRLRNQIIPVVRLRDVIGLETTEEEREERFAVIVHANGERAGFIVDDIVDEREILVKSLPKHFAKVKHISSATVASNNDIIMVLHVPDLIAATKDFSIRQQASPVKRSARSILVVDDSLNTREIEKTILQAYGYEVETAKDGLDAMDKIQERRYDLIVTDLEMPAMDGLTLTSRLKSDKSFQHIPVIIVTSRDSADDKRRGIEAGANAYIVKGSFDQTNLIDTVESLIG